MAKAKSKKTKPSGLRKYWPHLTLKECEIERQKMSDAQGAKCAICNKHENEFKKKLSVDHRHHDGLVRGLLCFYCNKYRVGRFTLKTIKPVIDYLLKYEGNSSL